MKTLRTGMALLAGTLMLPGMTGAAGQQPGQQQPSLGEIARRLREKKKEAPKPAHIWDNDNIPTTPNAVSVVGTPPPPPAPEKGEAGVENTPAAAKGADQIKEIADTQAALLEAKASLQNLQSDLDFLSRQLQLDQQQFYGKPDFASDREGKAKLDNEAAQVEAKRQDVAAAQAKIDELQNHLDSLKAAPNAEQPAAAPPAPPAESPAPAPAPAPPVEPEPPAPDSGPPPPADSGPPPPPAS
jgi:polyhydroxyalkanoate synthesis regulator phasin